MLGHVYVVEDAKDLAQILRDVTRYGGAYRPEVMFKKTSPLGIYLSLTKILMKGSNLIGNDELKIQGTADPSLIPKATIKDLH